MKPILSFTTAILLFVSYHSWGITNESIESGSWNKASNWSLGVVPSNEDTVITHHHLIYFEDLTISAKLLLITDSSIICGKYAFGNNPGSKVTMNSEIRTESVHSLDSILVHGLFKTSQWVVSGGLVKVKDGGSIVIGWGTCDDLDNAQLATSVFDSEVEESIHVYPNYLPEGSSITFPESLKPIEVHLIDHQGKIHLLTLAHQDAQLPDGLPAGSYSLVIKSSHLGITRQKFHIHK